MFFVPSDIAGDVKAEVEKLKDDVDGMTLRDYFAAKAMQSLFDYLLQMDGAVKLDGAAKDSYRMADAMLKARGKND